MLCVLHYVCCLMFPILSYSVMLMPPYNWFHFMQKLRKRLTRLLIFLWKLVDWAWLQDTARWIFSSIFMPGWRLHSKGVYGFFPSGSVIAAMMSIYTFSGHWWDISARTRFGEGFRLPGKGSRSFWQWGADISIKHHQAESCRNCCSVGTVRLPSFPSYKLPECVF